MNRYQFKREHNNSIESIFAKDEFNEFFGNPVVAYLRGLQRREWGRSWGSENPFDGLINLITIAGSLPEKSDELKTIKDGLNSVFCALTEKGKRIPINHLQYRVTNIEEPITSPLRNYVEVQNTFADAIIKIFKRDFDYFKKISSMYATLTKFQIKVKEDHFVLEYEYEVEEEDNDYLWDPYEAYIIGPPPPFHDGSRVRHTLHIIPEYKKVDGERVSFTTHACL